MTHEQRLLDTSKLNHGVFMQLFGGLYEHSPWIAEAAWKDVAAFPSTAVRTLAARLKHIVENATQEDKLALLRAHPELAGKAAIQGTLTAESTEEQTSARLDLCSTEEYEQFQRLNAQYNDKFGFPFIMAVRNSTRVEILEAFALRLHHTEAQEFKTALEQVHQIAQLRLTAVDLSAYEKA